MSSDATILVKKKESPDICFYGEYQSGLCLASAISIAHHIYKAKPDSYLEIFENPGGFDEDFFSYVENASGDTSAEINLDTETLSFDIFCWVCAQDDEESQVAQDSLLKLLPYFNGDPIPETAKSLIASAADIVNELWIDEVGELADEYEFFSSGEFVIPLSELSSFKEMAYSWSAE